MQTQKETTNLSNSRKNTTEKRNMDEGYRKVVNVTNKIDNMLKIR